MTRTAAIACMTAALLFAVGIAAQAQPASKAKTWRIGWVGSSSAAIQASSLRNLREGLADLGYVEGRNVVIEPRNGGGDARRLGELVAELERAQVDVIVTSGEAAALSAKRAARSTPIVVTELSIDPVKAGLVASLGRPDGNLTGIATLNEELWPKRLALLKQIAPRISRPAVLWNPDNPGNPSCVEEIRAVAPQLGLQPSFVEVRDAAALEPALRAAADAKADALALCWDDVTMANARRIADFALMRRLPLVAPLREYAEAGALISLGASLPVQRRRAAYYVDRIFKGAKPSSLPLEQPAQFELVNNQVTARGLGIVFPGELLVLADDVIH
jgi:putative ABC transport system substrate-binding protein